MYNAKRYFELFLLIFVDLTALVLSLGAAYFIRKVALPEVLPAELLEITIGNVKNSLWILPMWVFFFYYEGLYTRRFSFWDEIKAIWRVSFFSTVGAFTIVSLGKLSDFVPRSLILLTGLFAMPIIPFIRINIQRWLRQYGLFRRRVVIIGAGELGRLSLSALRRESNFGYEVIGFIDDDATERLIDGVKIHKGVNQIGRFIRKCKVSTILIALPKSKMDSIQDLINKVQTMVERVMFIPDLQSIPVIGAEVHHFFSEQIFSLELKNNLKKNHNLFLKRTFDIITSCIMIIVFCIPMMILSVIIMLDSPGPALFTQVRMGRRGRAFKVYKFRTMYRDAEQKLSELLTHNKDAQAEWETYRKLRNDPRITRIGNFLRKTSLDELPQLINVVLGEMSLVGPRPVTEEEISIHYNELAQICFSVPPGITGLWQVSGRNNADYAYRVMLDAWYVRNWSLWLDIVILLKTVKIVIKCEGAY